MIVEGEVDGEDAVKVLILRIFVFVFVKKGNGKLIKRVCVCVCVLVRLSFEKCNCAKMVDECIYCSGGIEKGEEKVVKKEKGEVIMGNHV